jgi:hypothetical protein
LFVYLFCWVFWFVVVSERRRLKRDIEARFWKEFEKKIRVCRLFLCWIFCVERRSFRLWILWFDLDSFFAVCFWICCVSEFFFDFKKFREWRLVVVYVVLFDEKRRIKNWKKNCLHFVFVCLFLSCFVCRKLARFCFFCLWISWMIVCCSEFEKKRNRSEKKIKFLDEKIVIKSDVSNLSETNNSSFSSLNESCIETIEIEKKEKERKNSFCFEFFAIDFALNCFRINEIENLWSVVAIIKKIWKYQKIVFKKKKKERMIFGTFNQYRENRSISNESDIKLTHDNLKKKRIVEIVIASKRNKFDRSEIRTDQIFDDDCIVTNFANIISLIDHYVRVKNFRNISFQRLQYYEVLKSIRRLVSKLRSRKERKNSSFVSILRSD